MLSLNYYGTTVKAARAGVLAGFEAKWPVLVMAVAGFGIIHLIHQDAVIAAP